MEEVAERGRAGAGAAAMAEGGSTAGEEAANANAASSPSPCSPPEGGGTKPLSAAEYARRVHQWLWDSYCGYLGWQGCPPAFLAAAAAAAAQPPPPAAAAYYSPFYLFTPPPAHTAPVGTGPRAPAAATPAWPGAAGAVSPLPRAASGSAAGTSGSGATRDTGRPAGEWGRGWAARPGEEERSLMRGAAPGSGIWRGKPRCATLGVAALPLAAAPGMWLCRVTWWQP
ncbi:hypothetical protein Nmel_000997 [Mimus melanotis]